jgi:antitoxin CptB
MTPQDNRRKRLLYQSQHRGMREMDIILGGYAEDHIRSMAQDEIEEFEALLAIPDQQLYGWFFEKEPVPGTAPKHIINTILKTIESR